MAAYADEADTDEEREYYTRMRDAWITLANRCVDHALPSSTCKKLKHENASITPL
jgi:hypothetical protein